MGKRTIKQELLGIGKELRGKWTKLKRKEKIMLAGAGIFLLVGFSILLAPKSAKQKRLRQQQELTEVILSGGEIIEIEPKIEESAILFYDSDTEELDLFGDPPPLEEQRAALEAPAEDQLQKAEVVGLGILEIEKINLRLPVAEGATKRSLRVAAGHVSQTAGIGQEGNAVIAAHRSYTKGELFNRLDELAVGDSVLYTSKSGTVYRFEVADIQTLEPSDSSVFDIRTGERDLTLYTCTPVRVASHRLAVRCTLVETIQ